MCPEISTFKVGLSFKIFAISSTTVLDSAVIAVLLLSKLIFFADKILLINNCTSFILEVGLFISLLSAIFETPGRVISVLIFIFDLEIIESNKVL